MNKLLWFLAVLQVSCAYSVSHLDKKEVSPYVSECSDEMNTVYLADKNDCTKYFVCSSGNAIEKSCDQGLFFDVKSNSCTTPKDVTCDPKTPNAPIADTSFCLLEYDVKNIDGSYVMSLCYHDVALSYDDASMACRNHGMRLMRVENSSDQTAKMAYLVEMLGNGTGGIYYVSGTGAIEKWYHDDDTRVYANMKWNKVYYPCPGCLILNNEGPMAFDSKPCSQKMHSICEYNKETIIESRKFFFDPRYKECTFPEDVKCDPRTPKPRVNTDTSICRWRKDVKNIDGSYVMSLCYYDVELLYDDASMACRNHGMRLMRIENNSDQTAKMAHLVGMLGNGTGGIYHISGTSFVGRWFNDDNSQIYADIKWNNGKEPWSGCLILNNEGPMAIDSEPCSQEMHSICEYNS
ncbi:unnamed protein product [Diamesa hyperborea]